LNPKLVTRIARWSAVAAVAIALIAAGIFAHRQWLESRLMRQAPAPVPASVKQQSLHFTFSKMDGEQTVFTIHAARATQYRGAAASVLDDVDIVVHGEHGERDDQIRTRSCEYEPKSGGIVCHGNVSLDLSSLPLGTGSPAPSAAGKVHIETRGVSFDRDTGEAQTNAPVTFRFPQGEGSGFGVEYSSRAADLRLRRDVKIRLAPTQPGEMATVVTSAGGLTFNRKDDQLRLAGPVRIRQGERVFDTGQMTIHLNHRLRPVRAISSGGAIVRIAQGSRRGSLHAESAEILFDPQGRAARLNASSRVVVTEQQPAPVRLQANRVSVTLDPSSEQPRQVDANGNVRLAITRPTGMVHLNTQSLSLAMAPVTAGKRELRLVEATAPGLSNAQWTAKNGDDLQLESGNLAADFDANDQIRALRAACGVELDRHQPSQPPLVTKANELAVNFSGGRWTEAVESGDVRAEQGKRRGRADRATFSSAEDRLLLAGAAQMSDPSSQLFANVIEWNQKSQKLRASGNVRASYTYAGGGKDAFAATGAGAVNIVASSLNADLASGHAVYSGSARLWAGNQVLQANRIELDRAGRELIATGNVLAAFPQARPRAGGFAVPGRVAPSASAAKKARGNSEPGAPVLWRVRAGRLIYVEKSNQKAADKQAAGSVRKAAADVTLSDGVEAWSSQGRMQAKTLVLNLQQDGNGRADLARAIATGGVTVHQGPRWGTGENASYDAATGKFVLWGGNPSLRDASGDLVTGDQLTFSVADDTIQVESSEGSRTLTRHPVPNR
jgi:lipopolysaccharide export system protein LptA